MPRNPNRIDPILRELGRLWKMLPDMRLGQLVYNIAGRDPFHIEDVDLVIQGFVKFGHGEKPDTSDWPEYWVEPNAFKQFLTKMHTQRKGAQ